MKDYSQYFNGPNLQEAKKRSKNQVDHIHDAFEAIANSDGDHMIFEENRCERLIDNGVELENHGRHCHIRRNYFIDIFQAISMQPLCGHPWPGPNYVYQNIFYRTPEDRVWRGSAFKIGIQRRMWNSSKYRRPPQCSRRP